MVQGLDGREPDTVSLIFHNIFLVNFSLKLSPDETKTFELSSFVLVQI